jgi:hypothetical protein
MLRKALVATTLLGTGLVVGLLAARILLQYGLREQPETTIVLQMVSGVCTPTDPLPLVRRTNNGVSWKVTNQCGEPYDVQLRNFRPKRPDGTYGDVETVTDRRDPGATVGTEGGAFSARLIKDATSLPRGGAVYKYEIWLAPRGATQRLGRDPDLEIWP